MTGDAAAPSVLPRSTGSQRIDRRAQLAVFDSCVSAGNAPRILVLKLDHLGDFLIGLPALRQLRAEFPDSRITLVCGRWNVATASDLGIADDIRSFDYFPQNAQDWDGQFDAGIIERFRAACAGQFDIAVDLRVDEDTRPLLRHVDAAIRCGIGSRRRHPYLNVVLPPEFERRETAVPGSDELVIAPSGFHSRMPVQTAFLHETDFSVTNQHVIYGPYCQLPLGKLLAELTFQLAAPRFWSPRVQMKIDVVRHDYQEAVAALDMPLLPKSVLLRPEIRFTNDDPYARYEIRTWVGGKPWWTRLRFFGLRLKVIEASAARFRPSELHIGESLALLVRLIAERVRPLYRRDRAARGGPAGSSPPASGPGAGGIVVAPFSNSLLRNWPLDRYVALIGMLLARVDGDVLLAGSADQFEQLEGIRELLDGDRRVVNLAGQVDWAGLTDVVASADLVIANNSGVAHLAASRGTPTLAIYSASHQPQEWGPRGETVRVLMAAVPCSPCGHDKLPDCPHDHLCMTLIEPENVLQHALDMLDRTAAAGRPVVGAAAATS